MADALLGSRAVFRSRAAELGLEEGAIQKAIEENIGSMGAFGFGCRFVPGSFKGPLKAFYKNSFYLLGL